MAPAHPPTAVVQPSFLLETAPVPGAASLSYAQDDRFQYRSQVGDLLKRGEKLQAVNLLRQKTGASLLEALKQIETWG